MIVNCITVYVKQEHIEDFKKAIVENHMGSVEEPGNIRFDVLQSRDDPSRFMLYEAFEDADAVAAHKETSHYLKWKGLVETWMAKPRQGASFKVIAPEDREKW